MRYIPLNLSKSLVIYRTGENWEKREVTIWKKHSKDPKPSYKPKCQQKHQHSLGEERKWVVHLFG
jgi:hypothetical protein